MSFRIKVSPETLTILTTYKCTAACQDCCFECSPRISTSLSEKEIISSIEQALRVFPKLKQVVFSGGECFLLKNTLFSAIEYASKNGLLTRCITNGYWGKNLDKAIEIAAILKASGLNEVNISTGVDHQKWVPLDTVLNAATSLVNAGIFTLITVEADTLDSSCLETITSNKAIQSLRLLNRELFMLQSNAWMPFHKSSQERKTIAASSLDKGCDQLFKNCVVTAKGEVSACCGLTLEHIPEMKLGRNHDLSCFVVNQEKDFLKLWLYTDGPVSIIRKLKGDDYLDKMNFHHQCQACVVLHTNKDIRSELENNWHDHIIPVMQRYHLAQNGVCLPSKAIK